MPRSESQPSADTAPTITSTNAADRRIASSSPPAPAPRPRDSRLPPLLTALGGKPSSSEVSADPMLPSAFVADSESLAAAASARLGTVLKGKWRLERILGIGGMASVYAATHRNGKLVAVKMLHAEISSN